jgi:outer membrane protein OmpA-like peptidoglycan-associated protein
MHLKTLFLSSATSLLSGTTLSLTLLGTPSLSLAACVDYQAQINQAIQLKNLDKLEPLLATLQTQTDCPKDYLDGIAQTIAAQANSLTQQGQLAQAAQAERWLQGVPTTWVTQVAQGNIAAHSKQWQNASQFYNQALDLMADPQATPQAPPQAKIKKVFQLASEAQILAGNLDASISKTGEARGVMRDNVRGFQPKKRIIPVQFGINQTELSKKGQKVAQRLAAYLKRYNFIEVTLIGHDSPANEKVCACVSERRAKMLKTYLKRAGVSATIRTGSKGDREPLQLSNRANYSLIEIEKLHRRVEMVLE